MVGRQRTGLGWAAACILAGCTTTDVTTEAPEESFYTLSDVAFGEYLVYLEIPGVTTETVDGETVYIIDTTLVDGVSELSLSKTSSAVETLAAAGLATAETKIVDVDGLQFFTNLRSLSLTANDVTQIDLTQNTALREVGLNFNLVGELDVTQNTELVELRYRGSAQAEDDQLLRDIDLSGNANLRHLFLPNHRLIAVDLSNNPLIDDVLDLSGNPGPDGDPDTADIVVPAAIYDQVPSETRLGVVSSADVVTSVSLRASGTRMDEAGGTVTLTLTLNQVVDEPVVVSLAVSGSAELDADYSIGSTSVTIPGGTLSTTTVLTGLDDDLVEGAESFTVSIESVQGAEIAAAGQVTVNIDDDELSIGLVLNEVLYDPSNEGLDGDANGDGAYAQNEDEFIELVNDSTESLDLSGWEVFDAEADTNDTPRHTFAEGTVLDAGEALVLFGGGTPTGGLGGALVVTSTTGDLNLNNSGDVMTLRNADGQVILSFDIEPLSNNPNESYTRNPDLTGDFEQHADNTSVLFSPGTRTDGTPF